MSSSHPRARHSLLDGVDLKKPDHRGYIYKQSHTHAAFNRRYCVLYNKVLVYYETEEEFKRDVALGTLQHRHKAIRLDGLYLTKPEKKPFGAHYCFILHTPHKINARHEYLMVTHTREERRTWMEKLQNVNPSLLAAPEHFVRPDTPVMGRRKEIRADSLPSSTHPGDKTHSIEKLDVREGASDSED